MPALASTQSTIFRSLLLWVLSNAGGTLWLLLDFTLERFDDYPVALLTGLVAALVSLAIIPLVIPFFALMCYLRVGLSRRMLALGGVTLFFALANQLLLALLPIGSSWTGLLSLSFPYWIAALLTVLWLYGPARQPGAPTSACG